MTAAGEFRVWWHRIHAALVRMGVPQEQMADIWNRVTWPCLWALLSERVRFPFPMPPSLGYCRICRKQLTDEEVELCTGCYQSELAGPMEDDSL